MTSDTSFVIYSTLGLAASTISEGAGIRLERQDRNYASTIKVLGRTGQGVIAVPAIYSTCEALSHLVSTRWQELTSTFGGSFAIGLAYAGAITLSAVVVITPTVLEIAKTHILGQIKEIEDEWRSAHRVATNQQVTTIDRIYSEKVQNKRDLLTTIETLDGAVSFIVKTINLVYLISLAIFSGMSAPIALGVTLSSLTILPVIVEKFL